jgi:hypothetical protein
VEASTPAITPTVIPPRPQRPELTAISWLSLRIGSGRDEDAAAPPMRMIKCSAGLPVLRPARHDREI